MSVAELHTIFHPRSIAVVGASENHMSAGSLYLEHLITYGYKGEIFPINPKRAQVHGLQAYPSLAEVPGTVDYVICCIPGQGVLDLLDDCSLKEVKCIHLFTGRFGETGNEQAAEMEQRILKRARELGIRLLGPNCMGLYYPQENISYTYELSRESGNVGVFFQSGGASIQFIRYASLRGIRFSKAISYGNAIDVNETELLQYFAQDPETKVIACYIEGVRDGKKFLAALREAASLKPVVVLKAGRGKAGTRAAASHTGALAGSTETWGTAIKQAGAIQAQSLEEMIDLVVGLCFLSPVLGRMAGVVGGGGGISVLSADTWEAAGFELAPLPVDIMEDIKGQLPEMWWNWIGNPVDVSMMPESAWATGLVGELLRKMAESPDYDIVVFNLTTDGPFAKDEMSAFLDGESANIIKVSKECIKPVVAVMNTGVLSAEHLEDWRWKLLAEHQSRLVAAQVPVYSTIAQAASIMSRLANYYCNRAVE